MEAEEMLRTISEAVHRGDAEGVSRMLDEDPQLTLARLGDDWTLLMQAAWLGHAGVVRLLLAKEAEVDAQHENGNTALHMAASKGHEDVVAILISSGADIIRRGNNGTTALIAACQSSRVGVVQLLLKHQRGCGLDMRTNEGDTALWWASYEGCPPIIRALLLAGADHTIAGGNGETQRVAEGGCPWNSVHRWWEGELRRPYILHKARTIQGDAATRQQSPAAPVPAYLRPRAPGSVTPTVQVVRKEGPMPHHPMLPPIPWGPSEEEEMYATARYVMTDLAPELYTELLAGFHFHEGANYKAPKAPVTMQTTRRAGAPPRDEDWSGDDAEY